MDRSDRDLWADVVAAEQRLTRLRAEFYQSATSRPEILAEALHGSNWERGAALSFLRSLPDDVPALLEPLVECATSPAWALAARQAIAGGTRGVVLPRVRELIARRLDAADTTSDASASDAEEYRRLAELLWHLDDGEGLALLVERAGQSSHPAIREVAEDFSQP